MSRRNRQSVPQSPRKYTVSVPGRGVVAEVTLETGGGIVSVVWTGNAAKVSGPDRERAIADLVRRSGLDPKVDHDRLYGAVFPAAKDS